MTAVSPLYSLEFELAFFFEVQNVRGCLASSLWRDLLVSKAYELLERNFGLGGDENDELNDAKSKFSSTSGVSSNDYLVIYEKINVNEAI